jgi:hypothetical protein
VLTAFLDAVARKKLKQEYAAYYTQRSTREAKEEIDLLTEWRIADDEAWAILEKGEQRGRPRSAPGGSRRQT